MDDFDDKMDDFLTYSIVSGEFDDDEKASKRKENSKGHESQEGSSNYSSRRWSTGSGVQRTGPQKQVIFYEMVLFPDIFPALGEYGVNGN